MDRTSEKLPIAFQLHQAGDLQQAQRLYQEILAEQPNCAPAWHFLGLIAHQARQYDEAIHHIRSSVELMPNYVEAHRNLGIVFHDAGQYADATRSFHRVLELQPNNAEVYDLLGLSYYSLGNSTAAISFYQRALELQPSNAAAYNRLGVVHSDSGNLDDAVAYYRRAVELQPDFVEAYTNLGLALTDLERDAEAVACHQKAISFQPERAELYSNLGGAFEKQGKLDEAISCYGRAIQLGPDLAEAHVNLGNAQSGRGKLQEAAACYHRALKLRPDYGDAHTGLSALQLFRGDFASGWSEYEWRWRCKRLGPRHFQQQLWDGSRLNGKTILIHAEQGLGDTFQFIRYLPLVKAQGATVIMEAQKPLRRLLADFPGIDQLIGAGDELPAFDVYAPLLSLPRIFQTTLETIPGRVPYLFADRGLAQEWREKLQGITGFRVGVNCHGRSGRGAHRQRDIPIDCLASLAEVPGVRLINLQQGDLQRELTARCGPESVVDFGGDIDQEHGAFMDTAAIMMNLDLVISSDTSIPHLAGALGVPVWLALPCVPNWRWLKDREDSPWYPTMRLFRQQSAGDWDGVFATIRTQLYGLATAAH
jgi:tetratricopeptide (TPR) repeat protein